MAERLRVGRRHSARATCSPVCPETSSRPFPLGGRHRKTARLHATPRIARRGTRPAPSGPEDTPTRGGSNGGRGPPFDPQVRTQQYRRPIIAANGS